MGIYYRAGDKRVRVSDRILAEAGTSADAATEQQIDAAYRTRHIRFL